MISRFFVVLFLGLLVLPVVFGSSLFGFLDNDRTIFWPADINGEDINVGNLYADAAWINHLFYVDINVTDFNVVGDMNVTGSVVVDDDLSVGGDINAGGSIEAGVCVVSDCFSSSSNLNRWLDASGANWELNNAGLWVYGDIESGSTVIAEDLYASNDLEVVDDSLLGGDLNVGGNLGVGGNSFFSGLSTFIFGMLVVGDANFGNVEADHYFGDGSGLTGVVGIPQNVDGGFASCVYLASQNDDGGFANSTYYSGQSIDGGNA